MSSNISDVFCVDTVDQAMLAQLQADRDVWNLVTGITSGSRKQLRVYDVVTTPSANHFTVRYASPHGYIVFNLDFSRAFEDRKYTVSAMVRSSNSNEWKTAIKSTNFKYVLKNVLDDRSNKRDPERKRAVSVTHIGENLDSFIDNADRMTSRQIGKIFSIFRDNVYCTYVRGYKDNISVPFQILQDVCRALIQDKSAYTISTDTITELTKIYYETNKNSEGIKQYSEVIRNMFCREKWLIAYGFDSTYPIIIAAIDMTSYVDKLQNGGDYTLSRAEPPRPLDVTYTVQPRVYGSIEDIDPAHRDSIHSSLTFLKVAMGEGVRYAKTGQYDIDPNGLLPLEAFINPDAGALCMSHWGGGLHGWLLVDK